MNQAPPSRRLRGGRLLAAAILALAAPAGATPFDATLSFSVFLGPASSGSVSFFGSGSAGSTASGFTLPDGLFAGTAAVPVTTPSGLTRLSFTVLGNRKGSFVEGPFSTNGRMPISGGAFALGSVGKGPSTLAFVPLFLSAMYGSAGVGVGGFFNPPGLYVDFENWEDVASLVFVPWGKQTYHYSYHRVGSNVVHLNYTWTTIAGSDSRTPGGLGQLTLVSPTVVRTTLGAQGLFLVVASLTLNFVPEPGTLLLLGAGVAALGLVGRERLRRVSTRRSACENRP